MDTTFTTMKLSTGWNILYQFKGDVDKCLYISNAKTLIFEFLFRIGLYLRNIDHISSKILTLLAI